jgi:hypothetical protein
LCSNLSPKNILIERADVDADTAPGKRNLASPRISQTWIALVSMRSRLAAIALTLLYCINYVVDCILLAVNSIKSLGIASLWHGTPGREASSAKEAISSRHEHM